MVFPVRRVDVEQLSPATTSRVWASSAPNGSSISRTLGSMASARAMPTPLFHAAGKLVRAPALRVLEADKMKILSRPSRATARRAIPFISSPNITFCKAESQGSSSACWNTMPRS